MVIKNSIIPAPLRAAMATRLHVERPAPAICSGCGAEVEPIPSLNDLWLLPELCGKHWPGPGWARVGCQGAMDFEEWALVVQEKQREARLQGAGFPVNKPKLREKMAFRPPPQLLRFTLPEPGVEAPWAVTLIGATGTGKTTALASAASWYLFDEPNLTWKVRYTTESKLIDSLKPGGGRTLDWWAGFELLLIDEVGRGVTEWASAQMNALVDARLDSGLPLIMASNFGPKGLEQIYGQRFTDRLLEMAGLDAGQAYLALSRSWRHRDDQGRPQQRPVPM